MTALEAVRRSGIVWGMRARTWRTVMVLAACVGLAVAGCAGSPVEPSPRAADATPHATTSPTAPRPMVVGDATPPPPWLGKRVLPTGSNGYAAAGKTPPELRNRSIITVDELPPPPDGRFHATVEAVPAEVLARSSWTKECPVAAADLRYVTVSFRGFDGLAHTGELLVNRRAADDLVEVFQRLFAAGFPIERMRISTRAQLYAPPTGDTNTTEVYACRPVRGQKSWSQHAYGLAIDVNPFQNPYHKGKTVLPELATAYLDRADERPGMVQARRTVVRAFAAIGWEWGGDYRSLKDYMHFSETGG